MNAIVEVAKEGLGIKDSLAEQFLPMVEMIVGRIFKRLPQSVDYNEIYSAGLFGLAKAIDKYDVSQKKTLRGYVSMKITGAILDDLRTMGIFSRSLQQLYKKFDEAYWNLAKILERKPNSEELASFLGLGLDEYYELQNKVHHSTNSSLDDLIPGSKDVSFLMVLPALDDLLGDMVNEEAADTLREKRKALGVQEKEVIFYYYYCDLTLKEIGEIMELTESRICQIHEKALANLKKKLL